MKVVEAMQGLDHAAYVSHHSVMAAAHDDFAQNMQDGGSSGSADVHSRLAEFHRGKAEEHRGLQGQAGDADKELDDYEKMGADMTDDVHWPLHCGEWLGVDCCFMTWMSFDLIYDYLIIVHLCFLLLEKFLYLFEGIQEYFAEEVRCCFFLSCFFLSTSLRCLLVV